MNPAARTVKVEGAATDFNRAFGIDLSSFGNYVSYSGPITVPESLASVVVAVLGLDNRPVARQDRAGERLIEWLLAWWPSFPAAVDPHPLVWIVPYNFFQQGMNPLGVGKLVSGQVNCWMEAQHVAPRFVPNRKTRHNRRSRVVSELDETRTGTSVPAKEIDKDAFGR